MQRSDGAVPGRVAKPVWDLVRVVLVPPKMYFLVFSVIWIRWTFPRTQFYGLLNLSWKILIPVSLFTLILTGAMMKIFQGFHGV